jgi:hypothetical protein
MLGNDIVNRKADHIFGHCVCFDEFPKLLVCRIMTPKRVHLFRQEGAEFLCKRRQTIRHKIDTRAKSVKFAGACTVSDCDILAFDTAETMIVLAKLLEQVTDRLDQDCSAGWRAVILAVEAPFFQKVVDLITTRVSYVGAICTIAIELWL